MQFRAAIFDLDGTLLDSTGIWTQIDLLFLAKRGLPATGDYAACIAAMSPLEAAKYTIARFALRDTPEALVTEWQGMALEAYRYRVPLKPFAREYLLKLRAAGVRLATATALSPALSRPALDRLGLTPLFHAFCCTDEVPRGKSFPDVYLLAAQRLGVSPKDCLAFDDVYEAVQSINAAGMTACAVYDPESAHQEASLRQTAAYYLTSLHEAPLPTP